MRTLVLRLLQYRALVLIALASAIAVGIWGFIHLDIEAYPDPSPPLVEVITQNPSWSAEEMERQVSVPLETGLNGIPKLESVRSISIFGLSDIKLYFAFDSDYFRDRQEVLNRLQTVSLPDNLQPQLSPWSPIGEIFRYEITGPYSLNELKATQDWLVRRELKQVPGIIDITTYGGTTRQYQAEVDPNRLLQYNVTLQQVSQALSASNANVGGSYITLGQQNVNVRGMGLLTSIDDIRNTVIAEKSGMPIYLRDVADVREGHQPRLGKVGIDDRDDAIEGVVLLQRDEESLPALKGVKAAMEKLNHGMLPRGMHLRTLYDRSSLIHLTTTTVRHVIISGLALVTVILLLMLGDLRLTFITALTIPVAVLFAFSMMVLTGHSANLISIGAIDFGILVDASIVVLESIFRGLSMRVPGESTDNIVAAATGRAARPVLFSTAIILVAFIPLFTMQGVPGKIFAPMSVTYGFALTGALIFALFFAPVLASLESRKSVREGGAHESDTRLSNWLRLRYGNVLSLILPRRRFVMFAAFVFFLLSAIAFVFVGGEFMPPLEEGNLWVRATLPQNVSFETSAQLATEYRGILRGFPEVTQVISQMGRPDDGTDPSLFNNIEFSVQLKPADEWPGHISKEKLIEEMQSKLEGYPGVVFGFSQNIQDNVEEAMSGVKGENSLKLFGDDLKLLTQDADRIEKVMASVPGVQDIGIFKINGQPALQISIDRTKAARFGILPADVNNAVQAAVGGIAVTQVLDGDRRFDLVLRYKREFRSTPGEIRDILLPTADGARVPLSQVADVSLREGSFMIYRENDKRYIPIKFSVRGRDLAATMGELQSRLAKEVKLPNGYTYEWAGEYDSLRKEQRRLATIIPISLAIILVLLFVQFHNWKDALLILAVLPFACTGGVWSLLITHTSFSISAAVGFTSLIGVTTLAAVVFLSGVRRSQRQLGDEAGLREGSLQEMKPVMMACMAAGFGLVPAAISSGIGAQAQQPLARAVVGGMITAAAAILFLLPVVLSGKQQKRNDK